MLFKRQKLFTVFLIEQDTFSGAVEGGKRENKWLLGEK